MNAPSKAAEMKAVITAIFAFGTALWGWPGWGIMALALCMVLDYISGTAAAMRAGEWSSKIARDGLWHKLGEIFALLVAVLLDVAIKVIFNSEELESIIKIDYPCIFTLIVSIWYIFTELGSIIENAAKLGAPVPAWLKKIIAQLKEKTTPELDKIENTATQSTSHFPRDSI